MGVAMTALLNLNLDRFREPHDIDAGEASEDQEPPFADAMYFQLRYLKTAVMDRAPKAPVNVSIECSQGTSGFRWMTAATFKTGDKHDSHVGFGCSIQAAIDDLLSKLPAPVDLASILGYEEVKS